MNIKRENVIISHHTRLRSRHLAAQEVKEPSEDGAVLVLFNRNNYSLGGSMRLLALQHGSEAVCPLGETSLNLSPN